MLRGGLVTGCAIAQPVVGNYFYLRPAAQERYLARLVAEAESVPAVWWLVLTGLGVLASMRRRTKTVAEGDMRLSRQIRSTQQDEAGYVIVG
jgi:hypothetical protein